MGISVVVPSGWDARIAAAADPDDAGRDGPGEFHPFLHAATVPLPRQRGHYGGGVVELLGHDDAFVALVEFGAEALGSTLFAAHGAPRRFRAEEFSPSAVQRMIRGHLGRQAFFTTSGRPFCCFVVLGGNLARRDRLGELNALLESIGVSPARIAE